MKPGTKEFAGGEIRSQTRQALENLKAVPEAAGSGMQNALKVTVFLKEMEDFPAMNEIFAEYFVAYPPARSAVEGARLPLDALVEIECIAHK